MGVLGCEVWAGWEYIGIEEGVGRLGFGVGAGWEYMGMDGSVGLLGDEASEVMEAVLGRV